MIAYSIGVDLGGTNLRAAAVSRTGELLRKVTESTPVGAGRDAVIDGIVRAIDEIRGELGQQGLAGVGVGIPGFILMEQGVVLGAPNLPDFVQYPVRDAIEQRLGTRVILENDANAAALGEMRMGSGRDVNDLILLTLGTGIGGGIISGGKVMRGSRGMAAELGHITVVPNGNPCGCGNTGCVEKYASATAVSAMAKMLNLGRDLTAAEVYAMAKSGNERALSIFHSVGSALGILLAGLINTFDFPLYLLGGGMAGAWDLFEAPMIAETRRRSFAYRNNPARVERAALGSDAGLFGAACLPLEQSL
ncbi:MAG: ROK family protein [Bryobacteraceae bacterium]